MALIYHNGRFIPEEKIQKANAGDRVLLLLRSFLDKNEPSLVRFLVNTWQSQGNAITYKELREAILSGAIDEKILLDWMQDYSRFVIDYMLPAWDKAMKAGTEERGKQFPNWRFDPMGDSVIAWTKAHSAEFVTNVTNTQIEALRAVVSRAAVLEDLSVDELARAIRPMVGLTKPQATANMNYYQKLREGGMSPKKAQENAARYAARQHRHRAYNIARYELNSAYATGAHEGTKQAQAAGLLGEMKKISRCADDERVCKICGRDGLEGAEVGIDEEFDIPNRGSFKTTALYPPYHIGCRCCVEYVEISPP